MYLKYYIILIIYVQQFCGYIEKAFWDFMQKPVDKLIQMCYNTFT